MAWLHRHRGGRRSRVEDDESVTLTIQFCLYALDFTALGENTLHATKNEISEGIGLVCLKIDMALHTTFKGQGWLGLKRPRTGPAFGERYLEMQSKIPARQKRTEFALVFAK